MVAVGIVVSGLLVAATVGLWLFVKWKKARSLPPGPRGFGLLVRHYLLGQPLHFELSKLKWIYGEIVSFMYWAKPIIVLNNNYAIDQALGGRGYTFTGRKGPTYFRGLKYRQTSQAINVSEGDQWKVLHSILLAGLQPCVRRLPELVEDCMKPKVNTSLDLRKFCESYCLKIYSQLIFGNHVTNSSFSVEDLRYIYSVEHSFVWHYLYDSGIFSNGMRTYRNKLNDVDGPIWNALQRMRNEMGSNDGDDETQDGDTVFNNLFEWVVRQDLSDEEIVANLTTLLVYAVMSCAVQLHWCLLFWMDQNMELTNRQTDVEYCKAFVKETQRLRPILPLGYPRRVLHSTKLFGYTIPRDALILMNVHEVLNDSEVWDEHETFKPQRFASGDDSWQRSWLPFGAGRRCCIGADLSSEFLVLTMSFLLENYTIKPQNAKALSLEGRSQGLLQVPTNLNMVFRGGERTQ